MRVFNRFSVILIVITFTAFGICLPSYAASRPADAATGPDAPAVAEAIRELVELGTGVGVSDRIEPVYAVLPVFYFYEERAFQPAWSDSLRERLLESIDRLVEDGLRPSGYHRAEIEELTSAIAVERTARRVAAREVLMTDAWLTAARHLLAGRTDPRSLGAEWFIERPDRDLIPLLRTSLEADDPELGFDVLRPKEEGYQKLKRQLEIHRELAAAGGWSPLEDDAILRTGDRGPTVVVLRKRLRASGDMTVDARDDLLFEATVERAVRSFQRRHGLTEDGVVGPATRAALNITISDRIDTIIANLERWRWLPAELGDTHILVNLAAFTLHVVERGDEVLTMRVVAGRPYRRTPVLSSELTHIVFNPAWNVPDSIAATDLLQKVRTDPGYLARNGFRIYAGNREIDPSTVAWARLSEHNFPYRLRQDPGPSNALGRVKFAFPNRFDVYLHDSPERDLFRRDVRDFSSGCIRVERPVDLASWILGSSRSGTIRNGLSTSREQTVDVRRVPIHILYWTAWADVEGSIHFRPDVYHRDGRLLASLREPAPDSK